MRKIASPALGLAVILAALAFTAGPASARSHRHRRHHHHRTTTTTPVTPTCGPGTVLVTALNQCVQYPFPSWFINPATGTGVAGTGITISPSTVTLTPLAPPVAGKGTFTTSFTMSGLPPLTTFSVTGGDANCPMTGGGAFATSSSSNSITFTLSNTTPATPCQQGGHLVTATSAAGTPFGAVVTFTT